MKEAIFTESLTKQYDGMLAVDALSIRVERGEIYGFLGLNGAGKTTTIRMMLGMIKPSQGCVSMLGQRVEPDATSLWAKVGYLVEVPYAYPNLTVFENLDIVRRFRALPEAQSVDAIIERLSLSAYRNFKVKHLSLGNAQRLGLAKALIHEPELLILDEPTNGLDPSGILEVRELLTTLSKEKGVTVFISSHILTEIAKMAHRIGIIHKGQLRQEIDRETLLRLSRQTLSVKVLDVKRAQTVLVDKHVSFTTTEKGEFLLNDESTLLYPEKVATLLVDAGCQLTQLVVVEEALESYFLRTIS